MEEGGGREREKGGGRGEREDTLDFTVDTYTSCTHLLLHIHAYTCPCILSSFPGLSPYDFSV